MFLDKLIFRNFNHTKLEIKEFIRLKKLKFKDVFIIFKNLWTDPIYVMFLTYN